jgi:hypothetical protein
MRVIVRGSAQAPDGVWVVAHESAHRWVNESQEHGLGSQNATRRLHIRPQRRGDNVMLQPASRRLSGVLVGLAVLALVGCSGPTPSASPAGLSAAPASSREVASGSQLASLSLAPSATPTNPTTSPVAAAPTPWPTCPPAKPVGSPAPGSGSFTPTGSLVTATADASATLLPDGRVLVVGGHVPGSGVFATMSAPTAVAELYDPATGKFMVTGSMAQARFHHTATLLPNGKVLITGGEKGYTDEQPLNSAELYDPATGQFSAVGSMSDIRTRHTATRLPNGKVLIAGGDDAVGPLSSAELYDPATGQFSATGSLSIGRELQTATLLDNGKVLIAGGLYYKDVVTDPAADEVLSTAELYDPATGEFTPTGSMHVGRSNAAAIRLPYGRVLIAGGGNGFVWCPAASAEVYYPATGTFSIVGSLAYAGMDPQAALLSDGRVLIVGGSNLDGDRPVSAQVFDPSTGTFSPTGSTSTGCTAASLADGRVLVLGGGTSTGFLASAEVYAP